MDTNNIILEIEKSINNNYGILTSMGVVNGLAGVSLFYHYKDNKDKCLSFLEKSISGLNEDYKGNDIIADIIEIGILLDFYIKEGVIKKEEVAFYFDNYDSILQELLIDKLKEDNLNPVTGILKYGNYFINRAKHSGKNYDELFSLILSKIEKLAKKDKKTTGIYWVSTIEREGRYLVELGVKHGVIGIVDFLVELYGLGFEKKRTKKLINEAIKYVVESKLKDKTFLFPFCTNNVKDAVSFSFNLNYGDLGIAYGIHKAFKACNLEVYKEVINQTLKNAANFKDDENKYLTDANLFYGSLGIASLLKKFRKELEADFLNDSINYWYTKTKEHKRHDNEWAGFDTTFNKFDINAQLSMSHGIIGVGTALLNFNKDLNFDFLTFLGYKF
ncbi:hypothetical protein KUL156_55100 [Alteromonas sp. KUL156]|nr:hypothetical protein KUL154_58800 [Alteromonas sp. KUL154]GFE02918.1 hypothetical protein KUL156_55100 [Alteromonas sp. KUL156]